MTSPFPWQETEFTLQAAQPHAQPYTAVEVWADFQHENGLTLRRPAFWDGGQTWKVRFASPGLTGRWTFKTDASVNDPGLKGLQHELQVIARPAEHPAHLFYDHGFWRMSPGHRNFIHADGTPALLVADTPWAMPFRASPDQVRVYAADRQRKGFNAALLMTVQPDMGATGPRSRTEDHGFDVAFEDLPQGHLNDLNPTYFQTLDELLGILVEHEIVPVLQPAFHGYGWKGQRTVGKVVPGDEYARYCRYLVARYGARPAVYLIGADGHGHEPGIVAGGQEVHTWDAYAQPTGMHYAPAMLANAHQDADWLDFQWCQTGHLGDHVPERVADMWRNQPAKGVANGEPTYENHGGAAHADGWWQGHEAWSNLCAGGTLGVVYGAGSLWQWRLHSHEEGFYWVTQAPEAGWREALDFSGATHVGLLGRILHGLPVTDMTPNWLVGYGARGLFVPDELYIAYQHHGQPFHVWHDAGVPFLYRVVNAQTGEVLHQGHRADVNNIIPGLPGTPTVTILHREA